MKLFIRIVIWFFVFLLVVYACLSVFFLRKGKSFLEERLTAYCHRPVKMGLVTVVPPFGLHVDNLEIPQIVKAKTVVVQFSIPKIFSQPVVLTDVHCYDASFPIIRPKEGRLFLEGLYLNQLAGTVGEVNPTTETKGKSAVGSTIKGVIIENFAVDNGQILFVDQSVAPARKVNLEKIHLRAHNVTIPLRPMKTKFDFTTVVISEAVPFSGSMVEAKGWVNFQDLDMDGAFKMRHPSSKEGVSAKVISVKNDLSVEGKINLGMLSATMKKKNVNDYSFEDFALGALQSSGLDIGLNFSFKTQMNNFKVDSIAINGDVSLKEGKKFGGVAAGPNPAVSAPGQKTFDGKIKEALPSGAATK